jgi:hypothetical protein
MRDCYDVESGDHAEAVNQQTVCGNAYGSAPQYANLDDQNSPTPGPHRQLTLFDAASESRPNLQSGR